jgi:hypothetical protein
MTWLLRAHALAAVLVAAIAGPAVAGDAAKTAVFDFELIDTSLQGELQGTPPEDLHRLAMISDELRRQLADSGRYQIIDTAPAASRIAAAGYLHGCNRCAVPIAGSLGAELALTGTVQKVSNLILNINVYLDDVTHDKRLLVASVDIRGNTDESWRRGVSYLVRRRLLERAPAR